MLILGLLGMYFDAAVVFVTKSSLLFKLAVAILCSLINVKSCLPILKNTTFHKKNPLSTFIDFITKLSKILTEPNDDFSYGHFKLQNFILAQILTEKGKLSLQLLHPSMFIPTSTVIRAMRVCANSRTSYLQIIRGPDLG